MNALPGAFAPVGPPWRAGSAISWVISPSRHPWAELLCWICPRVKRHCCSSRHNSRPLHTCHYSGIEARCLVCRIDLNLTPSSQTLLFPPTFPPVLYILRLAPIGSASCLRSSCFDSSYLVRASSKSIDKIYIFPTDVVVHHGLHYRPHLPYASRTPHGSRRASRPPTLSRPISKHVRLAVPLRLAKLQHEPASLLLLEDTRRLCRHIYRSPSIPGVDRTSRISIQLLYSIRSFRQLLDHRLTSLNT